jgi:hypothetical protein
VARDLIPGLAGQGGWPVRAAPTKSGSVQRNSLTHARLLQSFLISPTVTEITAAPPNPAFGGGPDGAAAFPVVTVPGAAPSLGQVWKVRSIALDEVLIVDDSVGTGIIASLTAMVYINGVLVTGIPLGTKYSYGISTPAVTDGQFETWTGFAPTLDSDTSIMPNDVLSLLLIAQPQPGGTGDFTPVWFPGGNNSGAGNAVLALTGDQIL